MSTNDATDNQFTNAQPEVINHDSIRAADGKAGGETPRTFPRQVLTGNQRGTLNITGGIIVTNPTDSSVVGMGPIPDGSGDFGFFAQAADGNLLYKIVGSTIYAYDVTQTPSTNVMQLLKLPDGTYGQAVAAQGDNVADAFS